MAKCSGDSGMKPQYIGQECCCEDCNPTFGCPGCEECWGPVTGCDPSEAVEDEEQESVPNHELQGY